MSLDTVNLHPAWEHPSGLAAYDFGFGTVFFDYETTATRTCTGWERWCRVGKGPAVCCTPERGE